MDPQLSHRLLTTRRHFFGAAGLGIGAAALATLLDPQQATAAGVSGALPGLPHFAPKAKRVIYLFQSGAPSQIDLFDYKPRLREWQATELPDSVRRGQRLTGMTSRPVELSHRRFQVQVRPARPERRLGQRAVAAHGSRRRSAVLRQVDVHRGHQPRSGDHVLPNRRAIGRPAKHRLLAVVRPGHREPGPAGVRRPGLAGDRQPERSAALRSPVGQRLSADEVSGRQVSQLGRSGAVSLEPAGHRRCHAAADARRSGSAQSARARQIRRSGNRHAHRSVRTGVSHADVRAGADQRGRRAGAHRRHVRPRRANARHVRRQLPAGPPTVRARRALRATLSSRLGPAHEVARAASGPMPRHRSSRRPRW